jgi:predicted  nucleic acid-binding Zn-ribbon protein
MSTTASGLKALHQIHIQLRQVREQLDRGPKQIRARRQHAERKQAELETLRGELKKLRMAADQKGLQLKTNEAKIFDLRMKLNAASSNREFDIMKSQIEADTMANSVLEDEILEALDKVDGMQGKIAAAEQELAKAQAEEKRMIQEIEASEPQLRRESAELEHSLKHSESDLPGAILEKYRRLVQAHGADALAAVENKACTACYAILSPNDAVEINTGKAHFCKSCGRLLYASGELKLKA